MLLVLIIKIIIHQIVIYSNFNILLKKIKRNLFAIRVDKNI